MLSGVCYHGEDRLCVLQKRLRQQRYVDTLRDGYGASIQ
ncbi:uncharacterized, partial [Tachysurus ichikawai]